MGTATMNPPTMQPGVTQQKARDEMKVRPRRLATVLGMVFGLVALLVPVADAGADEMAPVPIEAANPTDDGPVLTAESDGTANLTLCIYLFGMVSCMEVPGTCDHLGMEVDHAYPNAYAHVVCSMP